MKRWNEGLNGHDRMVGREGGMVGGRDRWVEGWDRTNGGIDVKMV